MLSRFVALSRLANPESITIADSTFCYLAGVDPEDPNTVGTYSDGKSRDHLSMLMHLSTS